MISPTDSPLWTAFGWTMLHFLWVGTLIGLASGAIRIAVRRSSPGVRYGCSLACLGLMVLGAVGVAVVMLPNRPADQAAAPPVASVAKPIAKSSPQPAEVSVATDPQGTGGLRRPGLPPGWRTRSGRARSADTRPDGWATAAHVLPYIWLGGSLALLTLTLSGLIGGERLRRRCLILHEGSTVQACGRVCALLGIGRRVAIAACERISSPAVVGILRPVILLPPAALTGLSVEQLEMVLLHELGHVRRWDNLVNLLQRVIESLLFYHPAVWWVSRWARLERECCSDQLVLAHTAQPTGYAALLVMMATAGPYTGPRAAAALAETNLLTRTRRILNLEAPIMILSRKSLLLTLTLLLGSLALAVYAQQTGRAKADDQQLYPFWEKGNWGYIDKTGKVAIEPRQKLAWLFRDGRAAFRVAGKWGFLDTAGRIAIKPQFDEFLSFAEGFAAVRVGKQWAFVDRDGQRSAPRFEQARSFSQGLAPVKIGGQWGYVDAKLETIIKPRFQDAWGFTEGLAPVRVNRRWGFIDQTGKMVIEPRFYWVDNFSEGLAIAQGEGDDGGYVDKTGKLAIKQRFWDALPFSEGRAAVVLKPGGMYGLIDRSGKVVVEPAYDEIYPFSEGLAAVRIPAKENPPWGYIDVNGKLVIPAAYSNAETFSGGLAQVRNDRDTAYIDRNGTTVWKSKPVPESEADEEDEDKLPADDALVFASRIEGTAKPAREVSVLSSPQRGRYPDNTDKTLSRSVWDMIVYEGRIYLGGGDYWSNTGPVDIYSLVPGQSEFTKEFTVDEEMVSRFVIADGKLIVPGNDPRESWDLGNLYIKEAGKWAKLRTIPNGVLCFEMAAAKGILYAGVGTDHGQAVLYSRDWGHSWSPVLFQEAPGVLVSDGEAVHGFAFRGGMCTLEGDVLVPEAMVPRSMKRTWFLGEPHDFFFHEPDRPSNAVAFGGGIVTWTWFSSLKYGPDPARFVAPGAARGSVIEALKDARICDVAVDNGRLYALGVREQGKGFALTIYSTADVKTWRPEVTFESAETFPRSFVKAGDAFYVGLGAGVNNEDKDKVPPSTGDILRVVP